LAYIANIGLSHSSDSAPQGRFNTKNSAVARLHPIRNSIGNEPEIELEKFSKYPALLEELRNLEEQEVHRHLLKEDNIGEIRSDLILAIENTQWSRYALGKALDKYRAFFKSDRGWIEAASVIARALCCNDRTVRNIISDYEGLKALPEDVIDVAHRRGIDLAKKRYAPVVKALETSLASNSPLDAAAAEKIIKDSMRQHKHTTDVEGPFLPLTAEEKRRWKIRLKIRTALNNIQASQKLSELLAALEEEMQAVWGQTTPVIITITPRKSSLTIDGKKRRS